MICYTMQPSKMRLLLLEGCITFRLLLGNACAIMNVELRIVNVAI